ncbi:enoyl-CoA hydratase [Dongia sedimenti]|uniref:Enoyl-CoA hydratase domain-containing protein 3, mitochondrial n=1 Tax=Dongia sedimenti TaxID=3064282 RepID=A0ABU0YUV5_9PROT|nr:enoyl-CoA hydratase [Rhodospirillaceae bacterium R-7]
MTAASNDLLLRNDAGGICTLTLNRPAQRNALSIALMEAIIAELDRIKTDGGVRVAIITGAGPSFCSGHDLKELRADPSRAHVEKTFALCSTMMQRIIALPQPVIAAVHGIATAAGCQLVATCDLAVAAEEAHFATPGVNIGLFCSTPMVALSRAVPRKQAMEMLLTGDPIDARTALRLGLVNRLAPTAQVMEEALALAAEIIAKSPFTLKIGKEAFYRQAELGLAAAYDYASQVMTENMMALDAQEGIDAFLAKRKPEWKGC